MGIHMITPHYMMVLQKLYTATFYPDYDPETTSVDGYVYNHGELTWAQLHDASVGTVADSSDTEALIGIQSHIPTNKWYRLMRAILLFDISSLPAGATIQSVKLRLKSVTKNNTFVLPSSVNVFSSSPATNTDIVVEDYDQFGTTPFATAIAYDDWDATGATLNTFTFNAAGLAAVVAALAGDGIVKLALREATYDVPDVAPTWASNKTISYHIGCAAEGGEGTGTPELVIEYLA